KNSCEDANEQHDGGSNIHLLCPLKLLTKLRSTARELRLGPRRDLLPSAQTALHTSRPRACRRSAPSNERGREYRRVQGRVRCLPADPQIGSYMPLAQRIYPRTDC